MEGDRRTYRYKGREGVYVKSLEYSGGYAACDDGMLPVDEINTRTVVGQGFDLPITPSKLVECIDQCS
jgi:hypothetical protein